MPDDRTIKQSLPVEPADLEACVRDERWNEEWVLQFDKTEGWSVRLETLGDFVTDWHHHTATAAAQAALVQSERTVSG
jgi:hypothetical protein